MPENLIITEVPVAPGQLVIYQVAEDDHEFIRYNQASELPAIVVQVWSQDCINVQVFCDGPQGTAWKTSILRGKEPGQWYIPELGESLAMTVLDGE